MNIEHRTKLFCFHNIINGFEALRHFGFIIEINTYIQNCYLHENSMAIFGSIGLVPLFYCVYIFVEA